MKKLISILVIIITSLFIAGESLSLPNCLGTLSSSSWNNCFGQYTWPVGDKYIGDWKDGNFHGQGSYYFSEKSEWPGDIYIGNYRNGKMHGQGTYIFADGDKYIGDWKDGKKHGQGTYIWGDKSEWAGDRYVGEFQNDEKNGQGTYFYANGTKDEGVWKDGEYQYARKDSEPKSNYSNVEEIIPASSGSGFAVTSDGYVVTNYHVIDGCNNVEIIDKGQTIPATVISFDISNDLALLKSDFKPLHTFPLSRKNPYTLMEIYVAGYPFGYDISTPVKITRGIVSSLAGIGNNFSRVQIDAAIQPGNSGGPIINDKGNVIGVAVSKLDLEIMMDSYGVVPEGTNFGIKSNVVINFLESNNINLIDVNTKELSKERLGKTITDGTYYISCLMTMPQIEKMRERKVIFSDLK